MILYIANGGYRYFVEHDNFHEVRSLARHLFDHFEMGQCKITVNENELVKMVGGKWVFPPAYQPLNEREKTA